MRFLLYLAMVLSLVSAIGCAYPVVQGHRDPGGDSERNLNEGNPGGRAYQDDDP